MSTEQILKAYQTIEAKVQFACEKFNRDPSSVTILPVSKTFPIETIEYAQGAGLMRFGENKVQEMKQKALAVGFEETKWVIIGYLQKNKAKEVARYASELQSLDRIELAEILQRRLELENRTLDVLIQAKTSPEESKTGMAPELVIDFAKEVEQFPRLNLKGIMTISENTTDQNVIRECFRRARLLKLDCEQALGRSLPELSMGMSGDFEIAIEEGSTEVRIGSAIFGKRAYEITDY